MAAAVDRPRAAFGQIRDALPQLPRIDDHFWDRMLWLQSKQAAGQQDLVRAELAKMHEHLLGPLGLMPAPRALVLADRSR